MSPNPLWSLDPRRLLQMQQQQALIQIPTGLQAPLLQPGAAPNAGGWRPTPVAQMVPGDNEPSAGAAADVAAAPAPVEEAGQPEGASEGGVDMDALRSGLGKLFSGGGLQRGLAALGVGLSGLGPQQYQNPVLQRMAMANVERQRQGQGFGNAIQLVQDAQQASGGNRAAFASHLTSALRSGKLGPDESKLVFSMLQKNNEAMLTDTKASEESLAASRFRKLINDHPSGDYNEVATQNPDLVGRLSRQTLDALFKETEPVDREVGGNIVRTARAGGNRGKPEVLYTAPGDLMAQPQENGEILFFDKKSGELRAQFDGTKIINVPPGTDVIALRGSQGASKVIGRPPLPTEATRRGGELMGLDPSDPSVTRQAASTGLAAEKATPDTLLTAQQQKTSGQLIPGLLTPGSLDQASKVAGNVLDAQQQRKIDVQRAGVETTSGLAEGRQTRQEARKADKSYAIGETILGQLEALIPKMEQKGFMSKTPDSISVGAAATNRSKWSPWGKPGDEDLVAWNSSSGGMIAIERSIGDLGPRAIAAYQGALDVINHPTTAAAARKAFQQFREQIQAGRSGEVVEPRTGGAPTAAPAPPKPSSGGKALSPQQYQDIRGRGYTDEQIRAKGYVIP